MSTSTTLTTDELQSLVSRLDPRRADAPRQDWIAVGMAIHDADPSEVGYAIWEDFSRLSPKFNAKDCRAAWKSFKLGAVTVATLIKFANEDDPGGARRRPQEAVMHTKRVYAALADYADAHGVPAEVFRAAGWTETRHDGRLALAFSTDTGTRHRFLDGEKPLYKSPVGYTRCWYCLEEAIAIAERSGGPLILCNGEASTVAAQHHGVAACAVAGGSEKPTLPDDLLAELCARWTGSILVVLDCDATGRAAAPQLAAQLRDAGLDARAVNLNGSVGFDLADFCRLNNGTSVAAVQSLPDLPAADTPTDTPPARPRFVVSTEDDLYDLPPIRYLDRDLGLVAGAFHLIYGASGSGKTFFAIERAMRQAALGRRVLYIPTEDVSGLRYRVASWRKAHPEASGRLTWLQMPSGLDLQDHNQVAELLDTIAPYEYDHIVLDTLREAHSGDENSSQDTARINRAIQRLVATGAAIDVVHHTGVAGERPRGSTALFSNADAVLKVENDDGLIRVAFDKLRNAPPRDALAFGLVQQDTGLFDSDEQLVSSCILRPAAQFTRREARLTNTQRKVLETLALSIFAEAGAKAQQVIDTSEITRRHVYLALSALKSRGFVSQASKGDPFYITTTGRAQLEPDLVPAPSDLPSTAPESQVIASDPDVIHSDQNIPAYVVIHSDHTRRVITGSHTDHLASGSDIAPDPAFRAGKPLHSPNVNQRRGQVKEVDLPTDLPDAAATVARLKARNEEPRR